MATHLPEVKRRKSQRRSKSVCKCKGKTF